MALNEAVDWRTDLGGGTTVALVQAGTFRSDAGALFGPVPRVLWGRLVTDEHAQYFGAELTETSLVPEGEATLGRIEMLVGHGANLVDGPPTCRQRRR